MRTAPFWVIKTASSGNFLPTFRETYRFHIQGPRIKKGFMTLEDGTDRLSRNVGKELPLPSA
jgi:hypothetical protein